MRTAAEESVPRTTCSPPHNREVEEHETNKAPRRQKAHRGRGQASSRSQGRRGVSSAHGAPQGSACRHWPRRLWQARQATVLTPPRRGYHHAKACKTRKREFMLTKARSEELRTAEADAWRSATEPSSSARPSGSAREEGTQRELVDEQLQPQPDFGNSEMAVSTETPDAETIRRTRIVAKTRGQTLQCRPRGCPRGCEPGASTRVR